MVVLATEIPGVSAQVPKPGPIPAGSASIAGTVVDAQSSQPLGDVVVRLAEYRSLRFLEVKTNADGVFEFAGIADGEYSVRASNTTHVPLCYGATEAYLPRCTSVTVVLDQRRSGIDFRLSRGATIRGRVVDHEGRPSARASVRLAHRLSDVALVPGNMATTNQDGEFELTSLGAGEWVLAVDAVRPPDLPRLPTTYYPGVLRREDATELEITPGMVMNGVTIALPRVSASSITARVSSVTTPIDGVTATLLRVEPRMVRRITLSADGAGTVRGLPDGRYFIFARGHSGDEKLVAFDRVDVVDEERELSMSLQPAARITGRIVAQRGGLAPVDGVRVAAAWIDHGVHVDPLVPDQVEAGPDGYFSVDGLFGTRTIQLIGLAPEWQVQSVLQGRADITSTGVDMLAGTTVQLTVVVARR
ncbi:MAG: carboxypeptidase-like regulatory domain-containing protein [Acidobacteriota bacterium]|nr:carboxypeptidase-like regulatory domain-containing protein [Acidobacteriota bacterium]